jgi:HEAT repeat protein
MPLCSATRLLPYLALALAGCSSSAPEPKRNQFDKLDDAQKSALAAQLKEADSAYRSGEGFEALRDQMAQDPVAAYVLTQMLVRQVILAREGRDVGEVQMMRAAARMKDPTEIRAVEQIRAMGAAAAPCLVDLLKHRLGEWRELGAELLGQVGPAALPSVEPLLTGSEPKLRRAGMRAVAAMPLSAATHEVLVRGAADADFGVRSEALRGLDSGAPADAELLHKALVQDPDPLVRRSAAQALSGYRSAETPALLIAYLERCEREHETLGKQVAQESLQALSGSKGKRTPESWRSLFEKWHPDGGR